MLQGIVSYGRQCSLLLFICESNRAQPPTHINDVSKAKQRVGPSSDRCLLSQWLSRVTYINACHTVLNRNRFYFICHIERLRRFIIYIVYIVYMVQQLCERSEDSELNETFFSVKVDEICNKFKQVSDNLKQYLTTQLISEFQIHCVNGSSPIKTFSRSNSRNSVPEWHIGNDVGRF